MKSRTGLLNDGTEEAPKLRVYFNLGNLADLPSRSIWSGADGLECLAQLKEDGFEGIQLTTDVPPLDSSPLPHCGLDRINTPADADNVARKHADRGDVCLTVHAGWGLEDEEDVSRLVEAILLASYRHSIAIFLETHRATITQDIWRTVQLAKKFPEVRFNGDFSHYYCGQELPYGDWQSKILFLAPIFERVGFMHGRISSSGCMQVPIDADLYARPKQAHGRVNYMEHFRELWTRAMVGFLRTAVEGDVLIFAPELLPGANYYARLFPDRFGLLAEECDRYAQALLYKDMAKLCFNDARRLLNL